MSEKSIDSISSVEPKNYIFKFENDGAKFKLVIKDSYESKIGAFGVQVNYDLVNDVSDVFSSNYDSVTQEGDKFIATAKVTTTNGSVFSTTDTVFEEDGHVKINRTFKVEEANDLDLGFNVRFQIDDKVNKDPLDYKWFAPGCYYGNSKESFTSGWTKLPFCEAVNEQCLSNDNDGTAIIMNFADNKACSIMDTSTGLRETIAEDFGVRHNHIMVDERINLGGVGLKRVIGEDTHTQLFQIYPAYTSHFIGVNAEVYRMLPVQKGLERSLSFDIAIDDYESYDEACLANWRYSYDYYAVVDKRYSAADIYEASLIYLDKSFGYINKVPQYMTNSCHPVGESGFLYRNADIGGLMLSAGRRLNNQKYINNALEVITYQIEKDIIDSLDTSTNNNYNIRTVVDGLYTLCLNYSTELAKGFKHAEWLSYLMKKAEKYKDATHWVYALFFSELSRVTGSKTYLNKAKVLMEAEEVYQDENIYKDVLSGSAPLIEKEGAILALAINMNLYELTKDEYYLKRAEKDALITESFQMIQAVNMNPYDATGYGADEVTNISYNSGFMGNSRFLSYGINYVCEQTTSGDNASVLVAPEFYKLAQYTGDSHYQDFYEYLTYNSVLYVNMGDKVGYMDDLVYSSGIGFQNEYFGMCATTDPACYMRGSLHDSNLAWNMYAVVQNYERMYQLLGDGRIVACDDENRDFDLKKNKYVTETNEGYVVDLNELCSVSEIKGFDGDVEFSIAGTNFVKGKTSTQAKYVRLPLTADIKNVEIIGLPLTYKTLNYDENVVVNRGEFSAAMDWDYETDATVLTTRDIVIDLGKSCTIGVMALKTKSTVEANFEIYVSSDKENYEEYMRVAGEKLLVYTSEKVVENVRYVKITPHDAKLFVSEFKILGI